MRFISRLLTIIFLFGLMATTANAQDSLLQYDELEFTEIIEERPIQEEHTVQANSQETTHAEGPISAPNDDDTRDKSSLWAIFIAGFIGGFAALLMPCIFPMLPFTVSYFIKSSHNKGKAVIHATI
jgi:thiol:disulfide interchange protein